MDEVSRVPRVVALHPTPTSIVQGTADDVAGWEWMAPLADAVHAKDAARHPYRIWPSARHRRTGASLKKKRELAALREATAGWLPERCHI